MPPPLTSSSSAISAATQFVEVVDGAGGEKEINLFSPTLNVGGIDACDISGGASGADLLSQKASHVKSFMLAARKAMGEFRVCRLCLVGVCIKLKP
jgi:hypothetical protein